MPKQSSTRDHDAALAQFFTDFDRLRALFNQLIAAPKLTKRILVIHGIGGVGKSSLLRIFRLHCKSKHTPVALASGDATKSGVDVLGSWTSELGVDGVTLLSFLAVKYPHAFTQWVPELLGQRVPAVFTQRVPLVFTQRVPAVFTQKAPVSRGRVSTGLP